MAGSDGESSASEDLLAGVARDLAADTVPKPVEEPGNPQRLVADTVPKSVRSGSLQDVAADTVLKPVEESGSSRSLAADTVPKPVEESGSSSDDCADPLALRPGVSASASLAAGSGSVYAGRVDVPGRAPGEGRATARPDIDAASLDVEPEANEGVDLKRIFADLEAAEMLSSGGDEPRLKKLRQDRAHCEASVPASLPIPAPLPIPPQVGIGTIVLGEQIAGRPPPEHVMEAFAVLGLSITCGLRSLERKSRRLLFRCHPDKVKVKNRWQASEEFKKVMNAKEVILAWWKQDDVRPDESESEDCAFPSGEESRGSVDGDDSESVSDERQDEFAAAGITGRSMSRSPSSYNSDDEGDQDIGAELVEHGHQIRSDTLASTTGMDGPSMLNTMRQQARQLQSYAAAAKDTKCSECYQRAPQKGSTLCTDCRKELKQLTALIGVHR